MTPGARVAAAIDILDRIRDGTSAEQALTGWARSSRFAGSKDRAAIRDHVFDVLRARRSLGDGSGRALMIQLLVRDGADPADFFSGEGHAPAPLDAGELAFLAQKPALSIAAEHDLPDWLWPLWQASLGESARAAALGLQRRAEVFLRVNQRNSSTNDAMSALGADGIATVPHKTVPGCLRVTENPRRVKSSKAFHEGMIELQDASSQWAVRSVPVTTKATVLDYCAGGGGKALAFADLYEATVFAHDIAPKRMADLPVRAARAAVDIATLTTPQLADHAPFDVVFCDAPCSGSGTWRRSPDAKWGLTQSRLDTLQSMQKQALAGAAMHAGKVLAYATCSVLAEENQVITSQFLKANPDWERHAESTRIPDDTGDGFYLCIMMHK